jgi:tripartite-type tricarboxylate transporter receptor subunit TctC
LVVSRQSSLPSVLRWSTRLVSVSLCPFAATAASITSTDSIADFRSEHVRNGELRPLAVTGASRQNVLPSVPAIGEFVPGYEASGISGIAAPKNTPAEVIDKLNKEINAALVDPKFKARVADLGGTVIPGSPADFGKLIAEETEKWGKVIKFAGIEAE